MKSLWRWVGIKLGYLCPSCWSAVEKRLAAVIEYAGLFGCHRCGRIGCSRCLKASQDFLCAACSGKQWEPPIRIDLENEIISIRDSETGQWTDLHSATSSLPIEGSP